MGTVRINATFEFGQHLRIGHKPDGSSGPYTYLTTFPGADQMPFNFTLPAGIYQIELSVICPNCAGNEYSDPEVRTIQVLT